MPTFAAIALDSLLEPGASRATGKSLPNSRSIPAPKPHDKSKLERGNKAPVTERKAPRPQISPALYATPETTPLPDSPSSFPPSPYIINHKRRGPRLLKSSSEDNVSSRRKMSENDKVNEDGNVSNTSLVDSIKVLEIAQDPYMNGIQGNHAEDATGDLSEPIEGQNVVQPGNIGSNQRGKVGSNQREVGSSSSHTDSNRGNYMLKRSVSSPGIDTDYEDFFDPQDSLSVASTTDGEDNAGTESSVRLATPMGEFYDAWEELSSESGSVHAVRDVEPELRETRLSLLMEIEKRKQAEEALNNMQSQWELIRQQLACVGLTLQDPNVVSEEEQLTVDPAEDLGQQVCLARFVSHSIGRGIVRAELETEMEAMIEAKNFEITRLGDRLQYYEAVNREMSQRNQETIEMARRNRQTRKQRQRWIWGLIAAAITIGTSALALSYLPPAKGLDSANSFEGPESNDGASD